MTTEKIYGPWIKWDGGECPVPLDTAVAVKFRCGNSAVERLAVDYRWHHNDDGADIVEYCIGTEQAHLGAAEKLLAAFGYTITPPAKQLTFEDVTPMTEAPEDRAEYWTLEAMNTEGVASFYWCGDECDVLNLKRRMAYLDKEHALIAAKHIFGLKGGEL